MKEQVTNGVKALRLSIIPTQQELEFSRQHIIIHHQLEQQHYVETEHTVLAGVEAELVHTMVE